MVRSYPAKAHVMISKLVLGRWKLVTNELAIEKSYGGCINKFVHPSAGFSNPWAVTELSTARIVVVPIEHICLLSALALFTILEAYSSTLKYSASILCLERSSTSIGRKVPNPV